MRGFLKAALFAAVLYTGASMAAANGDEPVAADDPTVAEGRAFVEANCQRCHALGRDDESAFEEAPPLREIGLRYPVDSLEEAFAEGIVVGHAAMPEFELEPEEIDRLLTYMHSLTE